MHKPLVKILSDTEATVGSKRYILRKRSFLGGRAAEGEEHACRVPRAERMTLRRCAGHRQGGDRAELGRLTVVCGRLMSPRLNAALVGSVGALERFALPDSFPPSVQNDKQWHPRMCRQAALLWTVYPKRVNKIYSFLLSGNWPVALCVAKEVPGLLLSSSGLLMCIMGKKIYHCTVLLFHSVIAFLFYR